MNIALVSLDQVWEDKNLNWKKCKHYIYKVLEHKAEIIIFPETTLTGFSTNVSKNSEKKSESITLARFQKEARKNSIAIVFGMIVEEKKSFFNKVFFISCTGDIIGEYSKIHTFSNAGEDKVIKSGNEIIVVEYKNYKIGMSICYDLRFPELYSAIGRRSDLIVNIANWPKKRVAHWNTMLSSRAIENQIFVAGVNRIGIDGNGLEYVESSTMYNANGERVKAYIELSGVKIYDIKKKDQKKYREEFGTIKDRKIEFYKRIL